MADQTNMKSSNANDSSKIDEELEQKRLLMTGKLDKRDDERHVELQKKKEIKESTASASEKITFFSENFSNEQIIIRKLLEEQDSKSFSKIQFTENFDHIQLKFNDMQKFVSDSTIFLPRYELRKAHELLSQLQMSINDKRKEKLPKKKFGFKGKKVQEKENSESKLDMVDNNDSLKVEKEVDYGDCGFKNKKDEVLAMLSDEINSKDVFLNNLEKCEVKLFGNPGAIHIDKLKECKIYCGPVSGSIFIANCQDCIFMLPCQQLRIHTTTRCDFYIHVTSRAIIEDCQNVRFAPYTWNYPDIDIHYQNSGLDKNRDSWNDIDDFNWLASDKHSPNWSLISENQRLLNLD